MRNSTRLLAALLIAALTAFLAPVVATATTPATPPVSWACPPTAAPPAPPNPLMIYFGAATYVSGNDPAYMKNLCGDTPAAQPASWVNYTEADGTRSAESAETVAFLGLPGAVALDNQFAPLLPAIQEKVNKVVVASYLGKRFDVPTVVGSVKTRLTQLLSNYDKVVIFGSSTGGPLASQVVTQLSAADQGRITLLLGCSPAGNTTLSATNQTLGTVASLARFFGDTSYMEAPFWRAILIPMKMRAEWGTNYQADQILYNANYKPVANGALSGLSKVVYYSVTNDETVNDAAAYPVWQAMRGGGALPSYTEPGGHVAFASNTADWSRDVVAEIP